MRIASVCLDPGIPVFGRKGASVHVQELLRAYRRHGHEVVVVASRLGGPPPPDLADVEVHELGRPTARDAAARELACVAMDARAEEVLAGLADLDAVHERSSLWGGAGVRVAAARGLPRVLEVNAPLIDEQLAHRTLVHRDLAERRLRDTVAAASVVTAVSAPVAASIRSRCGDATPVEVVPNGVDPDRFRRPDDHLRTGPFTVGFVGTLKPWHGVELLVDAVAALRREVPDAQLLLVGDGPRRAALEERADELSVPLRCTGAVAPDDVPGWLHACDVAAAPYPAGDEVAYFSPLKVLEYLAAEVPVVASRTGQIPALLALGTAGVLVTPGDLDELADALLTLARDPARRRRLARTGRRHVERHHTWHGVAATTLALLRRHHPTVLEPVS